MVDPKFDPVGWLQENTPPQKSMTQLDRIEQMLVELMARTQIANRSPLAACTERIAAAQTVSARGFALPKVAEVEETQRRFLEPRCTELTGMGQAGNPL